MAALPPAILRPMERIFAVSGALAACLAVGLGAFGAHGLEGKLPDNHMKAYLTGVLYHWVHALALFAAAWAYTQWPSPWVTRAGVCFGVGILFFSGSLYLLAFTGVSKFGMVTPLGGVLWMAGWVFLAIGILKGS